MEIDNGIPNAHSFFYICWRDSFAEFDDEFCDLFDVDDIFAFLGFFVMDYLCTSSNLQGMIFGHSLSVCCYIP